MTAGNGSSRTFADHVVSYAQAGWPCILPVPPATKTPPPVGFTGAEGRDTDPLQLVMWAESHAGHSIALRMPADVIGIDVDSYVKGTGDNAVTKRGAETLAAYVAQWGPLPPTWTSTARGEGPSRIHLYRVPAQRYATRLADPVGGTGDVEIIQRHHRYAVVWPSPHPGAGPEAIYRWYDPSGQAVDAPPKPEELAELPAAWVQGLAAGAAAAGVASADAASGHTLLDQLLEDWRPECAEVTSARLTALETLQRVEAGSRHDAMTERTHHLVQLAAAGHPGVAAAVMAVRELWANLTAGEDRAEELERALLTSARKAVTAIRSSHQIPTDPCLLMGSFPGASWSPPSMPDPAGGPDEDLPGQPIADPPRWASPRMLIGAHAFDPNAGLDQSLAEKVLERTWPALRYAYDSNTWLLRCPEAWEQHRRLSPWAVATVASLMPPGDSTAEKGSEPHARAQRRNRLMSTAGARAVAGKMDDLVAGGMHPVAVALAELDSDPEVLWAGGIPWSLRASLEAPVQAPDVDPSAPHLHTAGVTPEHRPTPLWDAFLEAVWPDPALRTWALRVLSISVTGYADRALPILLGETGRGKTQVIALLMSVLGSYGHAADSRLLSEAGERAHASIVFALKGRRLSFIDEGPREGRWAQERLKQLTGGGELTANQMNTDPITFRPTHTLVLTANDEPVLTDPAVRSRTRLIPCDGDPELVRATRAAIGHVNGAVWKAEAPGVLAALMAEAAAWLDDPRSAGMLAAPEHIRYLAENLGAQQDPVAVWVTEETEDHPPGTPSRELYQAFVASCRANNIRRDQVPSETKWGRQLGRLGYLPVKTREGNRRLIRVRSQGFLPGMDPAPTTSTVIATPDPLSELPEIRGGLPPIGGGLVEGSQANPPQVNPQVNPSESVNGGGLEGSKPAYAHTHTHTRAGEAEGEFSSNPPPNPSADGPETGPDLQLPLGGGSEADPAPQPSTRKTPSSTRSKSAEATQRAAEKRAEARREKIAAASGDLGELPAVVTRNGAVRRATTHDVDLLLATITSQAGAELTVDVEHSGYPIGHADYALRTIQLGNEHLAVVLDAGDPDQLEVARNHLAAAAVLHAHSATADLVPLAVAGVIDLELGWDRMHDTAILAKLADPSSTGNDADLKKLSRAVLKDAGLAYEADKHRAALFKAGGWLTDTEVTTPVERSGWAQVDHGSETMVRYDASDVLDDAALAHLLPQPPPAVLERERAVQRLTARVAHVGIPIDGEHVEQLHGEHSTAKAALADQIRTMSSGKVENPGSNDQLGQAFLALGAALPPTGTGKPSVAAAVLEPMRDRADATEEAGGQAHSADVFARTVLAYKHHDTALKLFLDPYRELVRRGDGRARPTVYTLGADTGRMSCVRPNLQQLPRKGGMRACITADPGHLLVSADFAGVELRVAAALSGDRNLRAILDDPNRDLHWEVARIAFGPQATKAQRYRVKRGVFGRIYGGGVKAVAGGVGVDMPTAQRVIDAMDAITPELAEWSRMVRDGIEAGRTQFPTAAGRVIHLPKAAPHAGPNYCIQGTARELLVDALLRWRQTRWGSAVLWPVHDEIVAVVPEAEAESATEALGQCMTSELAGVPIIAEPSAPSFAWADSE